MVSRNRNRITPIEGMGPDEWLASDLPIGQEEYDDSSTLGLVKFSLPVRYHRLRQELMQDPRSRYFGIFRTEGDLWRHIVVTGLIALAEGNKGTREEALGLRLKEETLAVMSRSRSARQRAGEVVGSILDKMSRDIEAGDYTSSARFFDEFMSRVLSIGEEKVIVLYVEALLHHQVFKKLAGNKAFIEQSETFESIVKRKEGE